MKKVINLVALSLVIALATTGCNNSGNENATNTDTTTTKDTVQSDPSKFSDPH